MAHCDFYGIDNILNYIKLSGLSKFEVYHIGQDATAQPLYSNYECNTNEGAVMRFETLSRSLNPHTPYKIVLFDTLKIETKEDGSTSMKKSISKKDKMSATFCINSVYGRPEATTTTTNNTGLDVGVLKHEIMNELTKQREENEILKEIKKLSDRLDYLEDEEDEGEINGDNNQLNQLMGLLGLLKQQANPTLNGTTETQTDAKPDQKEILNLALKRLYAKNKNLAQDLTKLADISETNPGMFDMLINSLRNL
jgi:hypothetical protein